MSRSGRIDVHHHFVPLPYALAFKASDGDPSGWGLPSWSTEKSLDLMDKLSISTTILSLTAPGCTILKGPPAAKLARAVNEEAASIRDAHPMRFGFFAALPPVCDDVDATIAEIAYALDVLNADGVTLYTRYGPGNRYLGHDDLVPIWAELSRRKAVVFVHPTHLTDTNLVNAKLPQPMIDYPHETTRAAVDLIMNNRIREYPGCHIILSHAGGTLPYLASRAAHMLPDYGLSSRSAEEFLTDARSLYYDLALSSNELTLALLIKFAGPSRILFGTDFPYAPTKTIHSYVEMLDESSLSQKEMAQIDRQNALELFPRLK